MVHMAQTSQMYTLVLDQRDLYISKAVLEFILCTTEIQGEDMSTGLLWSEYLTTMVVFPGSSQDFLVLVRKHVLQLSNSTFREVDQQAATVV